MYGFNVLGLNSHTKDHSSIEEVLKKNYYTKDEIALLMEGYTPGEGGGSLSDYLKVTDADKKYLAKGNYLTSQDLPDYSEVYAPKANYALKSEIPTNYLTEEQYTGTYSKPEGGIPASDLAEGVIPSTLPASDVKAWAKADTKPTYTAEEVGAVTGEQVATLYSILEARIVALETASPSTDASSSKAYFAIIPGTTSTYKANLKSYTGDFTELTSRETTINSDDESGMVVVLYNNWIPEFSAYDENLQTWGTPIKLGSGSSTTGYTKTVDNTDYVLWYSTNAVVSTNRQFKITLK